MTNEFENVKFIAAHRGSRGIYLEMKWITGQDQPQGKYIRILMVVFYFTQVLGNGNGSIANFFKF
jgi:hypothetical protein